MARDRSNELTLLVKKSLFFLLSNLEWIHESQVTYISLWCSFSTKMAPTSPKSGGTTKSASYFISSPS
uniref:Uncharacterized protein n=1 Tax=Salix viminalis TaxID=40686 RepID=A0A6N2M737_SALVM